MPNHHQAKRPYAGSQPTITSYFAESPSSVSPKTTYSISNLSSAAPPDSLSPPLPSSVQANLLSVGMRVRKSVPEGYKTGTYSAFKLFSDPTPAAEAQVEAPKIRKPITRSGARELAPFCGIMKVGGLVQQQGSGIDSADMEGEDEDDVPALSQGSTNSDVSVESKGVGKRRFSLDEEDESIAGRHFAALSGGRIIAVPKRKGAAKLNGSIGFVGQENADADMDFGEAEFLDYDLIDEGETAGLQ